MREAPLVRRGRGSVSNETGRFESQRHADIDDGWSSWTSPEATVATQWRPDSNRTIITRNQSPDIHFDRSINPYRGCLLYTSPSPRDRTRSRMPSSA